MMINNLLAAPLWLTDVDPSHVEDVLAARAIDNGPLRRLTTYYTHLEDVHESVHESAALFNMRPDPSSCEWLGGKMDEVEIYICQVLDAQMN